MEGGSKRMQTVLQIVFRRKYSFELEYCLSHILPLCIEHLLVLERFISFSALYVHKSNRYWLVRNLEPGKVSLHRVINSRVSIFNSLAMMVLLNSYMGTILQSRRDIYRRKLNLSSVWSTLSYQTKIFICFIVGSNTIWMDRRLFSLILTMMPKYAPKILYVCKVR